MSDWLDDDVLAEQYADASNLAARHVLHARFSTADTDRYEWLFDQFDLPEDAAVLSLGAGHGALWATDPERVPDGWDVTVTDAYQGMVMDAMEALGELDREFHFDVVDARDVPYPDDSFDAVTAHHVLSHLDDADRQTALAEIRRVLKPGGKLYASATGADHLAELYDAASAFGDAPDRSAFSLSNGADQLREQFEDVERRDFEDALVVDAPAPLVAYVVSLPGFDPADGRDLEAAFRDRMADGSLELTVDAGVFVATHEP
ncbi:class I SAM-dependent methyltransferase [Halobacterium litoreum]|uniref:Class I SAM-dependent methyltransferase n=1 Tax=Halobacterium litoreum TaxID=2039234 RepID=A0ABD5NHB2_9EURY|nr:class I SAM-dependent methyltransferase [Halobacterium litoreum]UHH12536.1 class I SAM-dependent methyltransferase [Halobacterium litoreum]